MFYLPILKSKQGEFKALEKLGVNFKNLVLPLFEITPIEFDHTTRKVPKTIETHLESFCKKVLKHWRKNKMMLDISLVSNHQIEGETPFKYVVSKLISNNVFPIPVVTQKSSEQLLHEVNHYIFETGQSEISLRLNMEDLTVPDLEMDVENILRKISSEKENIHLVLDLGAPSFDDIQNLANALMPSFEILYNIGSWKSVTVVSGAFPGIGNVKSSPAMIVRNDWNLYRALTLKLAETDNFRRLHFGDYGIVSPDYFEFDPTKMSRSANVRYTLDGFWMVLKGSALKKSEDYLQYKNQAKTICESEYYLGSNYSAGDFHLTQCANGNTGPGNSSIWIEVGSNHHFTKIIQDLSAMYSLSLNN